MFDLKEIEWGLLTESFNVILSLKLNHAIIGSVVNISIPTPHPHPPNVTRSPLPGWACVFILLKPCHANVS